MCWGWEGEPCQPGDLEGEPHLLRLICIPPWATLLDITGLVTGLESVWAALSLVLSQQPLGLRSQRRWRF